MFQNYVESTCQKSHALLEFTSNNIVIVFWAIRHAVQKFLSKGNLINKTLNFLKANVLLKSIFAHLLYLEKQLNCKMPLGIHSCLGNQWDISIKFFGGCTWYLFACLFFVCLFVVFLLCSLFCWLKDLESFSDIEWLRRKKLLSTIQLIGEGNIFMMIVSKYRITASVKDFSFPFFLPFLPLLSLLLIL